MRETEGTQLRTWSPRATGEGTVRTLPRGSHTLRTLSGKGPHPASS